MKQFTANQDMPIKYTFQLGGGVKGRTIKAGEIITAIDVVNDIDSQSVSTLETLHRIEKNYFDTHFTAVS